MPVLIYIDHSEGKIKKGSLEALAYGAALARQTQTEAHGFLAGSFPEELALLGKYGITKVYHAKPDEAISDAALVKAIEQVVSSSNADTLVFSFNQTAKTLAPLLAARLGAGLVTGAVALPETAAGFVVKKAIYSGKAFAKIRINSAVKIVCINQNIFDITETTGNAEVTDIPLTATDNHIQLVEKKKNTEQVSLTDAEIVVAGGMGLKGPENWHLITDLANALDAAAACSRPVSDNGWRPHHEHVGQTGTQIAPNLYIAVGISGAIQHIGGVNRSKIIAAINKDADAPIFKVADYGMTGDLFEIVPQLTEAIKKARS